MSLQASSIYAPLDVSGDTVLITGATAGIGWATALRFGELGCKLVLIGRRTAKLEELKADLENRFPIQKEKQPVLISLDVSDTAAIKGLPALLERDHGVAVVDVIVNNAGLALGVKSAEENDLEEAHTMLQTNVMGVIAMTTAFVPGMRTRGKGHLVNISSVAAHDCYQGGSVYCATKHAVDAFTTCARHDLVGTPVRVTAISPGMVETEFSVVRFGGDKSKAEKIYENIVPLAADDIADQIVYAVTRPRRVQVADMISYPMNQAHPKYCVERKGVEGLGPGGEDWREAKKSRMET